MVSENVVIELVDSFYFVLILVLVEDGLRGRKIRNGVPYRQEVLILVLVEDGLRGGSAYPLVAGETS